jgi:hypothetical protein
MIQLSVRKRTRAAAESWWARHNCRLLLSKIKIILTVIRAVLEYVRLELEIGVEPSGSSRWLALL